MDGRRQEGEGYSEHMQELLLLSSYFFLDYSTEEKKTEGGKTWNLESALNGHLQ